MVFAALTSRRGGGSDPTDGRRPEAGRWLLPVMCAGMFLVLLDVTIVNVALPDIAGSIHGDVAALQWVVDGYAVTIASLLLVGGTVGDRIGHRRVVLAGLALFAIGSLACATAPTIAVLVAGRVGQGMGGALLLPSTMAVIADAFPERAAQARALGAWAAVSSLALPVGPLLGGFLVEAAGWRLVFWINVPLVVVAGLGALWTVPPSTGRRGERIDGLGLAGLVVGLAGLVFTIISAGRHADARFVLASALITVAALTGTVLVERRVPNPVLPLDLLRRRAFLAPNVVALTMNLVFNGLLFVITLYLQDVRGLSALRAGLLVLPLAVPLVALAPVSGRLTAARGPRAAVAAGCLVAAGGSLVPLAVRAGSGLGWLGLAMGALGCGAGLVTASVVAAVVRATPEDRPGLATGVSNTARQTGTATGVAIFGAVAGAPSVAEHFVSHFHLLAVGATVLWVGAFVVAVTGIERVAARPSDVAAAD